MTQPRSWANTVTFAGTEFTVDGLVSGDTIATVTRTSTGAAAGAAVGSYEILASDAKGAAVANYKSVCER